MPFKNLPSRCLEPTRPIGRRTTTYGTVFLAASKAVAHKINCLYVLACPFARKFHTVSTTDVKTFHTIKVRLAFFIEIPEEMNIQNFKTVW